MPELSTIARHAATVLAGQLAVMAFGVTDTIVAGQHGEASLAALSVGSAIFISVYVALIGVFQALLPAWAELRGARETDALGRSLRQSLYLCGAASVAGMALLLSPGPMLRWTEVPPALRGDVENYLAVLALALPPALLFRIYSTLNQALGHPRLVTWLQVGSLFIKLPLSIWFTFGGAGLPGQGVVGCAWATLVVNCSMLAVAVWLLRTQDLYAPLKIWRTLERPHWPTLGGFARLGIPAGLAVMVEVTSFTLMALFIARLGTVAAASHQIAANLAAVLYMMPLSLGLATSARVSWWLGARDERGARLALRTGFKLALLMAGGSAAFIALAHDGIARLYAGDNPQVVALAGPLLLWVALYHLADATQALCVFLLRSYGVAARPLLVYCVLLWGVGLGGGYLLAYQGLGPWPALRAPAAFWSAAALALALTAAVFTALLWRVVRLRRPVPA